MPRRKSWDEDEPLAQEFKPSLRDAQDLDAKLALYSPRKINGRNQYPFEQYLNDQNIIRFDEHGDIVIRQIGEFHRLNQINGLREWKRDKDLVAILETMPEEKAAHEEKIEKIRVEIRALFKGMKLKLTP